MSKKKHYEVPHEEHADETWLIPYSDLLTLLLALFIVLFATSTLDKNKAAQFEYAFSAALNSLPPEQINGSLVNFLDDVKDMELSDVALGTDAHGVVLTIDSIVLFGQGQAKLKASSLETLKKIATLLHASRYKRFRVIVEGHTSYEAFKSEQFPSVWELSSARAAAVVRDFIKNGVENTRLQAIGMANIAPAFPNFDVYEQPIPENFRKNRRVVIRVEPWSY